MKPKIDAHLDAYKNALLEHSLAIAKLEELEGVREKVNKEIEVARARVGTLAIQAKDACKRLDAALLSE